MTLASLEFGMASVPFHDFAFAALIIFLTTASFYFVGALLVKQGPFLTVATGLALSAATASITASVAANLTLPVIFCFLVAAFAKAIQQAWPQRKNLPCRRKVGLGFKNYAVIFLVYCLLVFIYGIEILGSPSAFNGHQTYFAGVSLELLRAEYFGRLKIFDNYPLEWGKYHFFTGALTALPQVFLAEHNLVTFSLAKLCVQLFLLAAVFELSGSLWRRRNFIIICTFCAAYVFTMLPVQVWWSLFTNNFSSAVLLVLSFQLLLRDQRCIGFFFILCFGLSSARCAVPAALLASAILVERLSSNSSKVNGFIGGVTYTLTKGISENIMLGVASLIVAAGVLVMVGTGERLIDPVALSFHNFYSQQGWFSIMSPAITYVDRDLRNFEGGFLKPSLFWHLYWVLCIGGLLWAKGHKNWALGSVWLKTGLGMIVLGLAVFVISRAAYSVKFYTLFFSLYYFIPITFAFFLLPSKLRLYVVCFSLAAILQIYFFIGGIAVLNYSLIEWLVLFGVMHLVGKEASAWQIKSVLVGALVPVLMVGLPLNPMDLFKLNPVDSATVDLKRVRYDVAAIDRKTPVCFQGSDADAAAAAASGLRVYFAGEKSDRYSISKRFGRPTEKDRETVALLCP